MIRLLIVDDHLILRQGLERLLGGREGIEVVGTASSGEEAVAACAALRPDVVLMDLEMPGVLDGIAATARVTAAIPGTSVIILTSFDDHQRIHRALDAGAVGYLLKDASADDLERAVRAGARGESPLDPKVARALVEGRQQQRRDDGFSDREREVLALVAGGYSNKRIAMRLGITERTVKGHLTSIFRRIGVDDRTQAALWAQRNGIVPPGEGAAARLPNLG
ncbi:MAG: response regulator transcription factor [Thermoleophilia bacterium]